jgi:Holliday junction resolvase RusA-like endonuclease
MFKTSFTVEGTPIAKGRPKFRRINNFVSVYTPAKTKSYEVEVGKLAKAAMGDQEPLETPMVVCVYISMAVPKSYSKKRRQDCLDKVERPLKKPDIDNVVKAITDAMNGIVYQDDCQIVSLHSTKVYASEASVSVFVSEELP